MHFTNARSNYRPPGKDLEAHTQVVSLVSIEWMRLMMHPDFWEHHIARYGGAALIADAAQIDQKITWDGKKMTHPPITNYNDVDIGVSSFIPPDASRGESIALQIKNTRMDYQRQARDRLQAVLTTNGIQINLHSGAPTQDLPILPSVRRGQLQQGQGPPAPAERAPTPTTEYMRPDDVADSFTISEVQACGKISSFLRYFRNVLGLHCMGTCTEGALWFHLARLVDDHFDIVVTRKDWKILLKTCNLRGEMLTYVTVCHFQILRPRERELTVYCL